MKKLLLLILGLNFLTCAYGQRLSDKDYEIYSKVLNKFFKSYKGAEGFVVVIEPEDRYVELKRISEDNIVGDIKVDSLDLLTKLTFEDKFNLKDYKISMASGSEIDLLTMDKNYDLDYGPFYKKYPKFGGFVTMSKLFLSSDRSTGALYVAVTSGPLSGGGYYIYFDLKKRKVIIKTKSTWVA